MPRQWESREEYDEAIARWLADVILAEFRRRAAEREQQAEPRPQQDSDATSPA